MATPLPVEPSPKARRNASRSGWSSSVEIAAAFYRDVLAVQVGADVDLVSAGHEADVRRQAEGSPREATVRRIEAVMACRERLELNVAPLLAVEELTLALAAG